MSNSRRYLMWCWKIVIESNYILIIFYNNKIILKKPSFFVIGRFYHSHFINSFIYKPFLSFDK